MVQLGWANSVGLVGSTDNVAVSWMLWLVGALMRVVCSAHLVFFTSVKLHVHWLIVSTAGLGVVNYLHLVSGRTVAY